MQTHTKTIDKIYNEDKQNKKTLQKTKKFNKDPNKRNGAEVICLQRVNSSYFL